MACAMSKIKYAIYCRKSTDDKERQTQSIADQIRYCVNFAKANKLELMKKPKDFSMFETEEDLKKEDQSKDADLYQETRDYFIIKEKKS